MSFIVTLRLCFRKGALKIIQSYTILFIYKSPFPVLRGDGDDFLQSYSKCSWFVAFFYFFFLLNKNLYKNNSLSLLVKNVYFRTSEMVLSSCLYLVVSIFNVIIMIFIMNLPKKKDTLLCSTFACCNECHYQ